MQREQRRAWRSLTLVSLALGVVACAPAEKVAPVAEKPKPPEVDPRALCAVVSEVEDARARGTVDAVQAGLEQRASRDRAAAFGAMYSIVDEDARWKAFKAERAARPESVVGHLGECFTYASWKMADQAKGPCAAADSSLKSLALVDVARGDLARALGDEAGAKERYQAALATDDKCVPALLRLARVEASSEASAAVATYDRALAAGPKCFSCAFEKAELVEKSQGIEAALPVWEAALALAPEHPSTVKRYAAAQAGRDDAAALQAYEKAISLGVNDASTLVAAARLAEKSGDLEKALVHARAAAKVQPDDAANWRFVATLATGHKDVKGAAAAYSEVLRLVPDDADAHMALARAEAEDGRWVESLGHLEAAVASLDAPEQAEQKAAADKELAALLEKLLVRKGGAKGNANRVIAVVQGDVRQVFEQQKKLKKDLTGVVEITVVTAADGTVQEVTIAKDSLNDAMVAAALVGNLRRATIVGGAKRYNFELEFQ